jgi:hypothetical protein
MNFIASFLSNFIKNKVSLKTVGIFLFILFLSGLALYVYNVRSDNKELNKEVITQGIQIEHKDNVITDLNKEAVKVQDSKVIDSKASKALDIKISNQKIKTNQIKTNLDKAIETIETKQISESEKSIEKTNTRLDSIYAAFCDADQKACSNNSNS